ncbi:helix-turn-helix domain-containing protein [Paenisporosarcina sp. OV554]|uniref:helix-turn-helix domain-containing protein n=1 Tax=Paenisporosarcina sp. OV554 TaxID=2135694 RepID=UPI000D3CE1D2|nr:XRE family transcriptional regulator [Paenisporosarcina sp. OV554]PUB17873.1 XRE family transcriptional regulator [Paenisporosarcina sp. OV554]
MEQMRRNLGVQLKKIRYQRGMSLDDMAKLTDVSKAQLAQMEKGESNPTVSTIWKIADGLKISFSSLLQPPKSTVKKISSSEIPFVTEDEGRYRVFSIIPYSPERGWELYRIELDRHCSYESVAHMDGVEESLTVVTGELKIILEAEEIQLESGDTLVFSGNQTHHYINTSETTSIIHLIITYQMFDTGWSREN